MKDPHQLWVESGGDREKYKELMIQEGHLRPVTDENRPKPHEFEGMTRSCACTRCGGAFGASWHIEFTRNPSMASTGSLQDG